MSDGPKPSLPEILGTRLDEQGFELVDLVRVPASADRQVRLRTIEEALEDFDQGRSDGAVSYLVQIRPRSAQSAPIPETRLETSPASQDTDSVYLADGRINLPYLQQNAELLLGSGEIGLARNIFKTILASGERSDLAHYGIARCEEAENNFAAAVRHYEESITYQPTLESYHRLSGVLMRLKKDQQAAEVLQRALHIRELPEESRFELHKACGNSWLRADNLSQAEKHYRQALQLRPKSGSALTNLGALHLQIGRISEARRMFQEAAGVEPRNDQALSGLGACALADGEKRAAHDYFAAALESNLQNPNAVFHLVKLAYELKTYATAARLLEQYSESAPVNANLMYSLAGLQFHLGRHTEATTTCRRILGFQPTHPGATELLKRIETSAPPAGS